MERNDETSSAICSQCLVRPKQNYQTLGPARLILMNSFKFSNYSLEDKAEVTDGGNDTNTRILVCDNHGPRKLKVCS